MKKTIIILFFPLLMKAQDSTKLVNVKLTAAVQWYATPFLLDSKNKDALRLVLKWANLQIPATQAGDTITSDTIMVDLLVALYNVANEISGGSGVQFLNQLSNQVAIYRNSDTPANTRFDRLCDNIDAEMINRRNSLLLQGRQYLRGN